MTDKIETIQKEGSCLCGAVKVKASLKPGIGVCHCGMCRKWTGGPQMSVHAVGEVEITGRDHVGSYASSDWAERTFCKICGSGLYYFLKPSPQMPDGEYILGAGLFDDLSGFELMHEVYIDHAPDWYAFSGRESRACMTEAEVMALYEGG